MTKIVKYDFPYYFRDTLDFHCQNEVINSILSIINDFVLDLGKIYIFFPLRIQFLSAQAYPTFVGAKPDKSDFFFITIPIHTKLNITTFVQSGYVNR